MLLCGPADFEALFGSLSRIVVFLAVLFSLPLIRRVIEKFILVWRRLALKMQADRKPYCHTEQ